MKLPVPEDNDNSSNDDNTGNEGNTCNGNSSTKKREVGIYSTIYVSNLEEDIIRDAEQEMDEKDCNRKHKMMIK